MSNYAVHITNDMRSCAKAYVFLPGLRPGS